MEDKRITKTKRNLKNTMILLLQTKSFEHITVAELCRAGQTSRITFYTYYENKYALINELFSDYIAEADKDYHRLQSINNPEKRCIIGYENLLECILNLFFNNLTFFSCVSTERNPYLFSQFSNTVFLAVDDYLIRHSQIVPRYSTREIAALICNGFLGVINVCLAQKKPPQELYRDVKSMYNDILTSRLFGS